MLNGWFQAREEDIPRDRGTEMTSEQDIYRAAKELIKQHGEDATIHAAMRADELLEAGDLDGQATWKRILKTIEELQSRERPEGEKLH